MVICCGLGEKTLPTLSQLKSLIAKVVVISSGSFSATSLVICCVPGDKTFLTLSQVKSFTAQDVVFIILLCNLILVIYCGNGQKRILPTISHS